MALCLDARSLVGHRSLCCKVQRRLPPCFPLFLICWEMRPLPSGSGSAQRLGDAVALFGLKKPLPAKTCLDKANKQTDRQTCRAETASFRDVG